MLIADFLTENYRLFTRDNRGNWIRGAEELMRDVDGEKTIMKQAPWSRSEDVAGLTIYPAIYDDVRPNDFAIEIFYDGTAVVHERYYGEAIPVIKFIVQHWPEYADIQVRDEGITFGELAQMRRPRMADNTDWFHGTTTENLPNITRFGLMPREVSQRNYRGLNGSETGVVYLTSSFEMAQGHAESAAKQFGGAAIVIKVDLTGLESGIVDDHDVRYSHLHKATFSDIDTRRIKQRPGESSFLTIGTIGFKGRIPANRLEIVWRGKAKKGRMQSKTGQFQFVDQLASLASQLSEGGKAEFFKIIGLRPSGWRGGQVFYNESYYKDVEKTLNSVYAQRSAPKAFQRWVNGMSIRAAKWRRVTQMFSWRADSVEAQIVKLLDAKRQEISNVGS